MASLLVGVFLLQGSIGEIEFEDGAEFLREGPRLSMGIEVVWVGSDFDDDGPASRVAFFAQAFSAQKCFQFVIANTLANSFAVNKVYKA